MPVPGLSAERCKRRNRFMALRHAIDTAPLTFLSAAPRDVVDKRLVYAHGTLPKDDAAALEVINANLPAGSKPLTAEDIYIHYAQAANDNFVSDRYMFIDGSSLKNMADDAKAGIAFMNSHRTGMDMSTPSELPFGKSFAGRYERYDDGSQRSLIGFYMPRGIKPNGADGPSTDDMHAMIDKGSLFDVSVGMYGGQRYCDVCQNPLRARDAQGNYLCTHAPGTTTNMTPEQIAAQKKRGVKDGAASYTYKNGHINEFSGVYDGAVPGAGFAKAMSLARQHRLGSIELAQARSAYAGLLAKGDFMDELSETLGDAMADALERRGIGSKPDKAEQKPPEDPQVIELRAKLEALQKKQAEDDARREREDARRVLTDASVYIDSQIGTTLFPAQRAEAIVCYGRALAADRGVHAALTLGKQSDAALTIENHPDGVALAIGDNAPDFAATMRVVLGTSKIGEALKTLTRQSVPTNLKPVAGTEPNNVSDIALERQQRKYRGKQSATN